MKKLLVLLLVLVMASLAGAATVSLTDAGNVVFGPPGSIITLTISSDASLVALDAVITVVGGDIISAATNKSDSAAYGWDPTLSFDPSGIGTPSVEIGMGSFMGNSNTIVGYVDVAYTGGIFIVSIAAGTGFGGSSDPTMNPPIFSTGVVTCIPEPMTVALLGLGGLMLSFRARKSRQ